MKRSGKRDKCGIQRFIFRIIIIVISRHQTVVHNQRNLGIGCRDTRQRARQREPDAVTHARRKDRNLESVLACLVQRNQIFRIVPMRGRICILNRLTHIFIRHIRMAIFILHVISAKAARSAIYRKIGHTLQRHHLFTR